MNMIFSQRSVLCWCFVLFGFFAFAQDTMRIYIPAITLTQEDEGETIEVPVYIKYPQEMGGFQLGLNWDYDQLSLDTVIFGPAIPENVLARYNRITSSQLRALVSVVGSSSFSFRPDSLLLTMSFTAQKFNGLAEIDFDPSFRALAFDPNGNEIVIVVDGGMVTYRDDIVRTQFSIPELINEQNLVSVKLLSRAIPPLIGFDFQFNWDHASFLLDSISLGDNPLGLEPSQMVAGDGFLRFTKDSTERDTTLRLPFGTELVRLFFTPVEANSTSDLLIGEVGFTEFLIVKDDNTVASADYRLPSQALFVEGVQLTDTVRLAVMPETTILNDTIRCATIVAESFIDVGRFDFSTSWPARLRLNDVRFPENNLGLDGNALLAITDTSARFSFDQDSFLNVTLAENMPIVELCFSGYYSSCELDLIELSEQPSSTFFSRHLEGLLASANFPYHHESGYLYDIQLDTFELSYEEVISHPDSLEHIVPLVAGNDFCLTAYPFLLNFDTTELAFVSAQISPGVSSDFLLIQADSPYEDSLQFFFRAIDPNFNTPFLSGEVATFIFTRKGALDTVPINLFPAADKFVTLRRENGELFKLPAKQRNGQIVFSRTPVSSSDINYASSQKHFLEIYPNPTSTFVFIKGLPKNNLIDVYLYDQLGRMVWKKENVGGRIDLPQVPAGSYWLRTIQDDKDWVNKIIIIND